MGKVVITHGDIKENYEIIAPKYFKVRVEWGTGATEQVRFDEAIKKLEKECVNMGGNAIICLNNLDVKADNGGDYIYSFCGTVVKIKE